jgi:hypothetical protein
MKATLVIALLVASLALPSVSHGQGLLRYLFDGISNQLGLDRGPIPKVLPRPYPVQHTPWGVPLGKFADAPRPYIQAQGF